LDSTAPADIPQEGRRKVLIVDDEPVFVDTFAMILGQFGYQVLKAYSGEQALEILENLRPDLLLADIVMYEINGVEVAMAARQRWPDCIIFLTTGHWGNLGLIEPATAAGFEFHLLGRPIHPRDLMRTFATAPLLPQPE
jgi:CheY-like chemotaxis protein